MTCQVKRPSCCLRCEISFVIIGTDPVKITLPLDPSERKEKKLKERAQRVVMSVWIPLVNCPRDKHAHGK